MGGNRRFGGGPWRITFDTNPDDCNLHCIMCEQRSRFRSVGGERTVRSRCMDPSLIEQVLRECRKTVAEVIPSTMGEPLLYRHFDLILDLCRRYEIKLNLTTNGTFPGLGASAWAEQIVPVASDVKVSWNGATEETAEAIMEGIGWDKALANVREFIAVRDAHAANGGYRCRMTFQVTFMERNVNEIPGIVRLAAELGVDRVKGHHVWAHFPELEAQSMKRSSESVARWNGVADEVQRVAEQCRLAGGDKVLLENFHLLGDDNAGEVPEDWVCPFLGREAWVNWEGRFSPCCAPDEERKALGEFGHVQEGGLLGIWRSGQYRDLVVNYKSHPLCRGCNMRRPEVHDENC